MERTAWLRTEEVLKEKFNVSFSHVVCRIHSAKLGGNILAYSLYNVQSVGLISTSLLDVLGTE